MGKAILVESFQEALEALDDPTIEGIRLPTNKQLGVAEVTEFSARLPGSALKGLSWPENQIKAQGAAIIADILPQTQITQLNIEYNQISYAGTQAIAAALPLCGLEELNIGRNQIEVKGVEAIAEALPKSRLTHLNLWANALRGDSAAILAPALARSPLSNLSLFRNFLGPEGIKHVADALPNTSITDLNVKDNQFENDGLDHLLKTLPASCVTTLDIGQNRINNDGVAKLVEALPHTMLTDLNLSDNRFNAEGLDLLEAAIPRTSITELTLSSLPTNQTLIKPAQDAANRNKLHAEALASAAFMKDFSGLTAQWDDVERLRPAIIKHLCDGENGMELSEDRATKLMVDLASYAHEQGEDARGFIMRTLPLPEALSWLEERGITYRAEDFLSADGAIREGEFLCRGGARALFEARELWDNKPQAQKAFSALNETEQRCITNIHQLSSELGRKEMPSHRLR